MPYSRPTLTALRQQAQRDVDSAQIVGSDGSILTGFLQKAVMRVLAWVIAGFAYLHYGYQDWIAQQAVPWTAEDEYALGWGSLIGVTPKPAFAAIVTAQFTGGSSGEDVPADTPVTRQSDGFAYVTQADVEVDDSGNANVTLVAVTAGALGNCDNGTPLQLTAGVEGLPSGGGTVTGTVTIGADPEDINTAYRNRYLLQYAAPPQGGDAADYVEWTLDVAGVTRAWVIPNGMGAGTVNVYFMCDISEATYGGFPQGTDGVATQETRASPATGDQLAVANALFPLRPVTALVYALAPTAAPQNFTIANLGTNNTTAMQAQIEAALTDMFVRLGYVGGSLNPVTAQPWPTIDQSDWTAALEAIPGLDKFTVTAPVSPIGPGTGQLPVLGTVSFSS